MLYYGKARLRLDRVLFALAISYLAVGLSSFYAGSAGEGAHSRIPETVSQKTRIEDPAKAVSVVPEKAFADLCLADSPGPLVDARGLPLATSSSSLTRRIPSADGEQRSSSIEITRSRVESAVPVETLGAEATRLEFFFGIDEAVSFGALMKSWEHALGHTVLVSEELSQSLLTIQTKDCPSLTWGQFKALMEGHGIAFLEQHVGRGQFVISVFLKP